ncbi:ATP synthase subunit alpha [Auxenochlorella protothecoides]|uniref:ATP synthase subunit alpha n=1 Tax=Auxenochlorella protothecoides TaxID=3075 RepID=A0A087SLV5_AUXPR|nr:ATP synthase subunit alpha [Auxenochlorella protothecoides]KFM26709.1 ATP synthase subunit alpha [Auxenochlorella protothecoides]
MLPPRRPRSHGSFAVRHSVDEEDWEAEMGVFRQRTLAPNQLETLRKYEAGAVELGKVLFCQEGTALVTGLNNDAEPGTALDFSSGAQGVLLWRTSAGAIFALVLRESSPGVKAGDGVVCRLRAILQVVDDAVGATTKRDYVVDVPVGKCLEGRTWSPDQLLDWRGQSGQAAALPSITPGPRAPLLAAQIPMADREQIAEALYTGVPCVDVLTPLGLGQSVQLSGRDAGERAALCQAVAHGARLYLLCAAVAAGEAVRAAGGHALVILDSLAPMVRAWGILSAAAAQTPGAALSSPDPASHVEVEGMLVSVGEAERRAFLSSLVQRAAKMDHRLGGGSLSLVLVGGGAAGPLLPTLIVEELMSLTDGQMVVVRGEGGDAEEGPGSRLTLDPALSVSRLGARVFPPLLRPLAGQVRLELAQARDAARFASDAEGLPGSRGAARVEALTRTLSHRRGAAPVPLTRLALRLTLIELLHDDPALAPGVSVEGVLRRCEGANALAPDLLRRMDRCGSGPEAEALLAELREALRALVAQEPGHLSP